MTLIFSSFSVPRVPSVTGRLATEPISSSMCGSPSWGVLVRPAIAYLRVSTDQQAREGVSLAAQEAKIRLWAQANDYQVVAVHQDVGLSGGRADNRPALQRAIQEARDGAALVVYSLSRLARSTRDAIAISDTLAKAGADLVSLTERLDTTSAAGKMLFRLMAVLAEFERDQISERTKLAMRHLRKQGRSVGHPPFGWKLGQDGGGLQEDQVEQRVIQGIRGMRKQGHSYAEIAKALESKGHRTKRGGGRWHPKVIRDIVRAVEPGT